MKTRRIDRRAFLQRSAGAAAAAVTPSRLSVAPRFRRAQGPHHRPRARRVVFLCMAGGPSQFELFDHKPVLDRHDGKPMPASITDGQPIAQLQGQKLVAMRSLARFRRHGESGQLISDLLPFTARLADELAIVRSMSTTQINHDPAHTVMSTGSAIPGRPAMGAWIDYALGHEADDLPGFVVLTSTKGRNPQPIAARQWHSGILPAHHQGIELQTTGTPVHYLANPPGVSAGQQRQALDALASLEDAAPLPARGRASRRAQYELAVRMQASVPALARFDDEPPHVRQLYGVEGLDGSFAANCLFARRLLERGVRFVQLYHRGWDHHGNLDRWMPICCHATDRGAAALLTDLRQRGMLDDTLVVWSGEFGRTPMVQTKGGGAGRDHHMRAFSAWLAGGGVAGGVHHGQTDDFGYHTVAGEVTVHDLHATILHLLGLDHERLSVRHQGLEIRLTGVEPARVVSEILA